MTDRLQVLLYTGWDCERCGALIIRTRSDVGFSSRRHWLCECTRIGPEQMIPLHWQDRWGGARLRAP